MTRETRRCGSCGALGRLRSPERNNRCCACESNGDGSTALLNARRRHVAFNILADVPTTNATGINLLHGLLQHTVLFGGIFRLLGNLPENFRPVARNHGLTIRRVGIWEDRKELLSRAIDLESGDNPFLLLYSGLTQVTAIRNLIERSSHPVIVLAEGDLAMRWRELVPGVLTISPEELPRRVRDWYGNAAGTPN